jgi:N-acetylated-alpha-linked acidic dipeptidase
MSTPLCTGLGILACLALSASSGRAASDEPALQGWPEEAAERQQQVEQTLSAVPAPESLSRYHTVLCQEPHPSGSAGDRRMIPLLEQMLADLGLEVERHDIWPYMPVHHGARVEVLAEGALIELPLQERGLDADPYSRDPRAEPAWNAYSGAGDVTAPVVYANYGTREDFQQLADRGVDLSGKIVVARYGRIYRGYKVDLAERAGAVGVLLFSDPADSGYGRGIPYPEGGYYNGSSIQRGSVKTIPYPGDPLTPFEPATEDAERLAPDEVELPRIPVQAIGWSAASEILSRMKGEAVPRGWQGGLPFAYRLTAGDAKLRVRLQVEQERRIQHTANVVGYLRGTRYPDQWIVVGCHSDAWTFGAGDPHAGTIVLYEMARSFARAAEQGFRPDRTIVFANWTAEEFGIIGSTEWCEAHADRLSEGGVAYLNLDMAAMGNGFSASASPLLKELIEQATQDVPQARRLGDETVHDRWAERHDGHVQFGDIGGGSDYLGFYTHLGIPSAAYGAWGSRGISYHTNYETLSWYRRVVGDDYEPARMLARIGNLVVSRLANAPLLPYDIDRYAPDVQGHLDGLAEEVELEDLDKALWPLRQAADAYGERAEAIEQKLQRRVAADGLDEETLRAVNRELVRLERAWLRPEGLPDRPWYRSLYASPAPDSGYAAWTLPLLRHALRRGTEADRDERITEAVEAYVGVFERLDELLGNIESLLGTERASNE